MAKTVQKKIRMLIKENLKNQWNNYQTQDGKRKRVTHI